MKLTDPPPARNVVRGTPPFGVTAIPVETLLEPEVDPAVEELHAVHCLVCGGTPDADAFITALYARHAPGLTLPPARPRLAQLLSKRGEVRWP